MFARVPRSTPRDFNQSYKLFCPYGVKNLQVTNEPRFVKQKASYSLPIFFFLRPPFLLMMAKQKIHFALKIIFLLLLERRFP